VIETKQCSVCGFHFAPSLGRHQCRFTEAKRLLIGAKHYLLKQYGLDVDDVLDACIHMDEAYQAILREENTEVKL
jgi:hypothetical protein